MCCHNAPATSSSSTNNTHSDEIDRWLEEGRLESTNEIKVLVVGPRRSGQSTLMRHMQLIHRGGYDAAERARCKDAIVFRTLESMRDALGSALEDERHAVIVDEDEESASLYSLLVSLTETPNPPGDAKPSPSSAVLEKLLTLQLREPHDPPAHSSSAYFLHSFRRILSPDYVPSDRDMLHLEHPHPSNTSTNTNAIKETAFTVGELKYRLISVGDLRTNREKWISCFEDVEAIIFVASLADYDATAEDEDEDGSSDPSGTMQAITLFDQLCNSKQFCQTPIILFLNKTDLLAEKLSISPLSRAFPDYTGGSDYDAACAYLLSKFVSLNKTAGTRTVFAHYTCFDDTQKIQHVLSAVQDILLQRWLSKMGVL